MKKEQLQYLTNDELKLHIKRLEESLDSAEYRTYPMETIADIRQELSEALDYRDWSNAPGYGCKPSKPPYDQAQSEKLREYILDDVESAVIDAMRKASKEG